jgi:CBS domain-containing protein
MKIREILQKKGDTVVTIAPDEPITEAVELLVRHNIGALVVMADTAIAGIISERDLLRAMAEGPETFAAARVSDTMTVHVITGTPDADINSVMTVMSEQRIRHLPVLDNGQLCGMVSIGDVVNAMRHSTEHENRQLHAYITGTPL